MNFCRCPGPSHSVSGWGWAGRDFVKNISRMLKRALLGYQSHPEGFHKSHKTCQCPVRSLFKGKTLKFPMNTCESKTETLTTHLQAEKALTSLYLCKHTYGPLFACVYVSLPVAMPRPCPITSSDRAGSGRHPLDTWLHDPPATPGTQLSLAAPRLTNSSRVGTTVKNSSC